MQDRPLPSEKPNTTMPPQDAVNKTDPADIARDILAQAFALGADVAGLAPVDALRLSPSERLFPQMIDHSRDHFAEQITTGLPHGSVFWEEDAKTVLIFGVAHPADQPSLDWWCGEIDPPGNKKMIRIGKALRAYILENYPDIHVYTKRYHVEKGGLYLKEAAVAAGLGCIGRNNLLVTPRFGPRVRLRAMTLSAALPAAGPADFDPCRDCPGYCRKACPQHSFDQVIYTPEMTGIRHLPGRDGSYFRKNCSMEMQKNEDEALTGLMPDVCDHPEKIIKYCRACELACPVGRENTSDASTH